MVDRDLLRKEIEKGKYSLLQNGTEPTVIMLPLTTVMELLDGPETTKGLRMIGLRGDIWYACEACEQPTYYHDAYCRHCGRKLKWEDWYGVNR